MGRDGTDVAREAADMILADDNFATIVDAVRGGPRDLAEHSEVHLLLAVVERGSHRHRLRRELHPEACSALRPLMILWINLVTNGLPALALGIDPPDPTQMMEPPRKASVGLLGARDYLGIATVGVLMGGLAIGCYFWPWTLPGVDRFEYGRAVAFSLLALSPLFHALNCRSATLSIFAMRPLVPVALIASMVVSAAIHLVSVLVPSLREVFKTYSLSGTEWLVLIALSASIVPMIELLKVLQRMGVVGKDLGPMSRRT